MSFSSVLQYRQEALAIDRFAEHAVGAAHSVEGAEIGLAVILEELVVAGDDDQRQVAPLRVPAKRDQQLETRLPRQQGVDQDDCRVGSRPSSRRAVEQRLADVTS